MAHIVAKIHAAPCAGFGGACTIEQRFLVVEPIKSIFLVSNAIPKKEDVILLLIWYHDLPKENTAQLETVPNH